MLMNTELPPFTEGTEVGTHNVFLGHEVEPLDDDSKIISIEPNGHYEHTGSTTPVSIKVESGRGRVVILSESDADSQLELGRGDEFTSEVVIQPGEDFIIYCYSFEGDGLELILQTEPDDTEHNG